MFTFPTVESLIARLAALGIALPAGRVQVDGYGDSPELSEELLALIRSGKKKAGTGLLWAYEADNQEFPQEGVIEIVIDHNNQPALVTRIIRVEIVAYSDVTAEYAALEGEGDGSLEYWRKAHWAFFSRECQRIGREPSQDMPVICSVFEVLNIVPRNSDESFRADGAGFQAEGAPDRELLKAALWSIRRCVLAEIAR